MKTKIAHAVVLGALFIAVPSATPKGGKTPPAALPMGVLCSDVGDALTGFYDSCAVTVTSGLVTGTTYSLEVTDDCVAFSPRRVTAVAGGINVTVNIGDCATATFSLFTTGNRGGGILVATSGPVPVALP